MQNANVPQPQRRWPDRRALIAELIRPGDTTAEIGVDRGAFSREMLLRQPGRHWAVDPYAADVWQLGVLIPAAERLAAARRRLAIDARVAWVFGHSAAWWPTVNPGELSFVYLDGSHQRDDVAADLRGAWRAVRPGGWIAGHDWTHDPRVLPGVTDAVSSFVAERQLELFLTAEPPAAVWYATERAPYRVAYDSWAFQVPLEQSGPPIESGEPPALAPGGGPRPM